MKDAYQADMLWVGQEYQSAVLPVRCVVVAFSGRLPLVSMNGSKDLVPVWPESMGDYALVKYDGDYDQLFMRNYGWII